MKKTRLLLTTVFQPYGVNDLYADATGMQMELLNNQITKEQGVHSPRASFWTFPLYILAENIAVPTTVLDFPRWQDFVNELKKGYTHVGISFIAPNVYKAKRMTEYIRQNYPDIQIILGGYGADLPDIREIVSCDEVCTGEGITWLRKYFNEDTTRPVQHPIMHGVARYFLYGLPLPAHDSAVIFPGVGCENSCYFCATSAKFGHKYIPFLKTGHDIFQVCQEIEKQLGVTRFVVIDENFLAKEDRAIELLQEMERHSKAYSFSIFSSADNVAKFGVEFLVRLGVITVWMGIEGPDSNFPKLRGIDLKLLVRELQSSGISVITSSILFLEHHDHQTIQRDIEWAIEVGSDFHQFTVLSASPGTPLYFKLKQENKLLSDFSYRELTGMGRLGFKHKNFQPDETKHILREAFRRKYIVDGPGILNLARTAVTGYIKVKKDTEHRQSAGIVRDMKSLSYHSSTNTQIGEDHFMHLRIQALKERAIALRPVLLATQFFAPNLRAREKAKEVRQLYQQTFGGSSLKQKLFSILFVCTGCIEWLMIFLHKLAGKNEFVRQPPVRRVEYRSQE
jgi:hypothetical protein